MTLERKALGLVYFFDLFVQSVEEIWIAYRLLKVRQQVLVILGDVVLARLFIVRSAVVQLHLFEEAIQASQSVIQLDVDQRLPVSSFFRPSWKLEHHRRVDLAKFHRLQSQFLLLVYFI